jgi:hypothetical protein
VGSSISSFRLAGGVAAAALLLCGLASLWLGQDYNFDLLNYHYYVGYAFLHDRLSRDVVPAGIQTYQPPLLHAFHYLGIAHLPPRVFGFLLGALHGLNPLLVFLLARRVLPPETKHLQLLAVIAAFLAAIGPNAVSMLGCSFGDNLLTVFGLAGLLLVLGPSAEQGAEPGPGRGALVAAGALAGIASGLKLTMGASHLALLGVVIAMAGGAKRTGRTAAAAWFLLGSVLGFLPTGGFWAVRMYQEFGNPLFPFANGLFGSEFYASRNFSGDVYVTRSLTDVLRPAFDAALGRHQRLQEIPLRDLRLIVLIAGSLWWLAVSPARHAGRARADDVASRTTRAGAAVVGYWLAGYLLWVLLFPYYRYLALLEIAAPLALLVVLGALAPVGRLVPAAAGVALLLAATTSTGSWGRRPWESTWLEMPIPPLGLQRHSLVLLVGQPIAFTVPSFREDATFVHLTAVDGFGADAKWRERIEAALAGHRGPVLLLSNFQLSRADAEARASALGFLPAWCEPVRRGPLRFRLCDMQRR